jgi:glycine/D-amino acid oxidase-like deaminating enzyme
MPPRVDPVLAISELPAKADVVVIGGGIVGASIALFLAERGVSVVLCEKGEIAGEQSSRNWGWCRKAGRDHAEIPLAIESLRLWEGMNARTNAETGFRQTGIVYLCDTSKEAAQREGWLAQARFYQIDSRLIGADEIDRLLPGSSRRARRVERCGPASRGGVAAAQAPWLGAAGRSRRGRAGLRRGRRQLRVSQAP